MEPFDVYAYTDFRDLLRAWYESERKRRGKFTKAEVSRLLGLPNTRNYFADVLGGKVVSDTFLERFETLLSLPRDQSRYFRILVGYQQEADPHRKEILLEELLGATRTPTVVLDQERSEYFRHWWHGAVRALLDTGDFGDDPSKIATALVPRITVAQAKESLALLADLGLVGKDARGFWKPLDETVSAPEAFRDQLVLQLQMDQVDLVRKSLAEPKAPPRFVATNLVSMSDRTRLWIEDRLESVRGEVRAMVARDPDPATTVCQIVLAMVPLNRFRGSM